MIGYYADIPMEQVRYYFQISQLIRPLSMFLVVYAVIRLTAINERIGQAKIGMIALRILVVLELIVQWSLIARQIGLSFPTPVIFWVSRHILYACLAFGVFVYLASVLRKRLDHKRAQSAVIAGIIIFITAVVTTIGAGALLEWSDIGEMLVNRIVLLFNGVAGVWAFVVLWGIQKSFYRMAEGLCFHCGYSLRSLIESRCPECGLEFERNN